MADLIVYIPNHGYDESDLLSISWLSGNYYVRDVDTDSFKISTDDSDNNIVQFTETVTDGFVREQESSIGTTIGGLYHLEGETVYVTNNGELIGSYTVSSGQIDVGQTLTTYQVGLPYVMKIRTMRLEVPSQETVQTRVKRINETVVRHIRAKGGKAGQEYEDTEYTEDINATFSTESEDATILTQGGFAEAGHTVFKSTGPYPFTVLATIISFSVDEA